MVIETGPTVSGVSGPIDLATGPSDGALGRSGAIVMDTGDAAIGPTSYAGDFDIRTGASFSTGEALPVGTINIIGGGNLGSDRTGNINITGGPNADAGVGLGGIVTITGGAATGSSGEAGDVLLVGGDASEPGKVILANAESADVDSDEVVFRYWNQGTGTGGGYFADFYVRDVAGDPDGAVTAQSGSLMIQVNGGAIPELWLNDTPGVLTGTDWSRVTTTSDVTLQQAYIGGNTIATSAPEGIFSVTGTEMITLMSTGANASLSALNVSITSLGAAAAGDVILTGGNSSGATNPGGDIFLNPGDGSTTGIGGTITGTGGIGGATGAGGGVSFTGGAGGLTNSIGGAVVFTGGPSTGTAVGGAANLLAGPGGQTGDGGKVGIAGGAGGLTSGDGGAAAITGGVPTDGDGGAAAITGASGVGTNRSGGIVTVGAGDSTGTATGAAVNVTGGNGDGLSGGNGGAVNITGGAGRIGGDVVITSGPPFDASDQAGDVHIIANKGVGTAGKIFLTTESDDDIIYPVTIDTQSGFADQGRNTRTFGRSEAVAISTLNQAVVNLGTLTNGDQLQVKVSMTAVDNLVDTNVVSFRFDGDFYMSGGTVTAMTPHVNNNTLVGTATFTGGISFAVVISGGTVLLEVSNSSGVSAFTLDISATFITQQGGAAA
jgi:hypothetical protein